MEKDNSGKEITYTGREVFERLMRVQDKYKGVVEIIPVTSRSEAEYLRIENTGLLRFRYAFIDNGAGLMVEGKRCVDGVWGEENKVACLEPYLSVLECCVDRIRLVDNCFYYGKLRDGICVGDSVVIGKTVAGQKIYLQKSGSKLYLLPGTVNKRNAVKAVLHFNEMYGGDMHLVCAGDSAVDVPMAECSDTVVFSDSIKPFIVGCEQCDIHFVENIGDNLARAVLDIVARLCKEM